MVRFRDANSEFHAQCVTAALFGLIAAGCYIAGSAYSARSHAESPQIDGLVAATPFGLPAITAVLIALLIRRGSRLHPLARSLPMLLFVAIVAGLVAKNAL